MIKSYDLSTVAAVSTPRGKGGIAVIRVSGPDAVSVSEKVFFPKSGKTLSEIESGRAVYGSVFSEGKAVDDGIAVIFRAPRSYTCEDTVEISIHGGLLVTSTVLSALFSAGAEPAGPGEFTKRAFLNGRVDLTGAEAVADVIDAVSRDGLLLARSHIEGSLSRKISGTADRITDLLAEAYVTADYPDEDLSELSDGEFIRRAELIRDDLDALLSTYSSGKAVTEGIPAAIVGVPNSGKSSLLNCLSGSERAIVTDVPGTTRDTIDETIVAGRAVLRLTDTAGIRETDDEVEKIGVSRAKRAARDAELIICVIDGSRHVSDEDLRLFDWLGELKAGSGKTVIAVVNKKDSASFSVPPLPEFFDRVEKISALTGEGTEHLRETISKLFVDGCVDFSSDAVLSNARQASAVGEAARLVSGAVDALKKGAGRDVAALDLESAHTALCETDGRGTVSEITDRIFSRFCVGK